MFQAVTGQPIARAGATHHHSDSDGMTVCRIFLLIDYVSVVTARLTGLNVLFDSDADYSDADALASIDVSYLSSPAVAHRSDYLRMDSGSGLSLSRRGGFLRPSLIYELLITFL